MDHQCKSTKLRLHIVALLLLVLGLSPSALGETPSSNTAIVERSSTWIQETRVPNIPVDEMATNCLALLASNVNVINNIRLLNDAAFRKSSKMARASGRSRAGVTVAEYRALLDSERSGIGFTNSLAALGWKFPGDFAAGVSRAKRIIKDVSSGEIIRPTEGDLNIILLYLGSDAHRDFVASYNRM
jgi:hypothetical protein